MRRVFRFSLILISIIFVISVCCWVFLRFQEYPISEYFPLHENDKYIYTHQEGIEQGIVTISVKEIKQIGKTKEFSWLWQGKYNDRLQMLKLTPKGIVLCKNIHLAGEVPMKVTRILSPPILMIPAQLGKNILFNSLQSIYTNEGKFLEAEKIEADISFVGNEEVSVEAGKFRCIHFFVRHNYKDAVGNSKQMHTYNFWITKGVGIVKFIHTFTPFLCVKKIKPEEKTIMNRYDGGFKAFFELKRTIIGGKEIGYKN